MPTQEVQIITKETQKIVLKAICESPTLPTEELAVLLKTRDKNISQEEVTQVLHGISPNKNWHRATEDDINKEVLNYLWTLENQILFLLPTKQKETTIAEFNQMRLQNKQPKVPKDLIRHLQTLLMVDSKNLAKFRKFQKDLTFQNDLDPNVQAVWLTRIILSSLNTDSLTSAQGFSNLFVNHLKEKYPAISEKVGKTIHRICERFVEKYFPKNISDTKLKELVTDYQSIFHTYKKGAEGELQTKSEFQDGYKIVHNIIDELKEVQEIVNESHEGGFLGKLLSGKVKNKEGVIKTIDRVIENLNQLNEINTKTNKAGGDKVLLVQKLQSDYDNIVFVKSQLENDLYNLNEKFNGLKEKNASMEKELHDSNESLEKAHEKIASLQQKVDEIPGFEAKANMLREELNTAKDIALRLYRRVTRIKEDLFKQTNTNEKPKIHKPNGEQKQNHTNNFTIHKVQQNQETGETTVTTEVNPTT